jgi:hypothetical protein
MREKLIARSFAGRSGTLAVTLKTHEFIMAQRPFGMKLVQVSTP